MTITICGGGNLGHTCAGMFSQLPDVQIQVLTGHPERWNDTIRVHTPDGKTLTAHLSAISDRADLLIPQSDIVLLCLPAFIIEKTILEIKAYVSESTIIGSIVANTGFFIFAHKHLPSATKLFSFQRVPFISRIVDYGKEANLLGFKDSLIMVVENMKNPDEFMKLAEQLFATPIVLADSFYEVTLSNSNPILHTGRLYTMWKDWDGVPYPKCTKFYNEWDEATAELEIEMDKEFFDLLHKLQVKTTHISTLLDHYDSVDAKSLTNKLRSIDAFKDILSPMKLEKDGWRPDFSSRYFTEDFPFGLRFIYDLAVQHGVNCPNISMVYNWGMSKLKHN